MCKLSPPTPSPAAIIPHFIGPPSIQQAPVWRPPLQDSVRAFRWALQNMYRPGDKLIVLHVMPDVFSGPASGSIYYVPPANDPEVERCLVRALT